MVDKLIAGFLPRIRQGIAHRISPTLDASEAAAQLLEYRMKDSQDLFSRQDLKDAMKEAAKEALMEMNKKKSIQVQVADDSSWDLEPEIYSIVQTGPQVNRTDRTSR